MQLAEPMTPLEQLDLTDVHVLDGGMATELEKLGCDLSGPLWSARVLREQPEIIAAVHAGYLAAGADCILTASYQVSAEAYSELGLTPEDAASSLRESVRIAEHVRAGFSGPSPRRILIAASLGPYGAALHNGAEYHGNYDVSFDQLVSFHARRVAVLAETNADIVAFETVPSLEEAHAIVAALEQFPQIAAWVSFTCRDASHTAHGEPIADCGRFLDSVPQVVAVGINCTAPAFVTALLRELKSTTTKPIVVYPNSGEGWDAETRCWTGKADSASFASRRESGVRPAPRSSAAAAAPAPITSRQSAQFCSALLSPIYPRVACTRHRPCDNKETAMNLESPAVNLTQICGPRAHSGHP